MVWTNAYDGAAAQIRDREGCYTIAAVSRSNQAEENVMIGNVQKLPVAFQIGTGGEIACELSDRVIFTSDNPRSEDPVEIIKEMEQGLGSAARRKMCRVPNF